MITRLINIIVITLLAFGLFYSQFFNEIKRFIKRPYSVYKPLEVINKMGTNEVVIDYLKYDRESVDYFKEIALRGEFTSQINDKPRRWTTDINIYLHGMKTDYMILELDKIVKELNDIIVPVELKVVYEKTEANFFIFLGSMYDFQKFYPSAELKDLEGNWGYFQIYPYGGGEMYVDMHRTHGDKEAQKHLLREELTQSLWLCNDSWKYPESIFYQGWRNTTEYSELDKKIISMLYN